MTTNIIQLINNSIAAQKEHIVLYNKDNKEIINIIKDNKIVKGTGVLLLDKASPQESIGTQELLDSSSRESGLESLATEKSPFGLHNVQRALWQFYINPDGTRTLKVRLNTLEQGDWDFIAPLQQRAKKSNFMVATENRDLASDFWIDTRKYVKERYSVKPQLGKFHLRTGGRQGVRQTIQVEPDCFASVWWDSEEKEYRGIANIYDIFFNDSLDQMAITAKQEASGMRCQALWINPAFDRRRRPMTAAQRMAQGLTSNN
jgi:hypothetical protein